MTRLRRFWLSTCLDAVLRVPSIRDRLLGMPLVPGSP